MSSNKNKSLEHQIITLGEKNKVCDLVKLLEGTTAKQLCTVLSSKLGRSECTTLWNYLLNGFAAGGTFDLKEKRYACVKCFLEGLLKIELSYRQSYDLTTRLCQDLNTFPSDQLVEILEHCIDGLRTGDPKCVSWKDLLPETLNVLASHANLRVNDISTSGAEFRVTTIRNLCSMKWPSEVLTPIADMFRELNLSASETITVLNKFSNCLQSLSPDTLPSLAYQLFSMCCTAPQIIIPILALEKYFHRFYYKKLFSDMSSNSTDFDSIDDFSDKEIREAEETILHHLNYCTQYKISEVQICCLLRNFVSMPDVILTPFVLSAILSMSIANREPDTRLSASYILPFLRNIIKSNEDERTLSEYSVWCRDSLHRKQVDLDQVFTVLIDQNKEGKDTITPGLVNLAFVLLKAKQAPQLNQLAIGFLTKFIRKRFIFGQGIVNKLAEWMIVEQDQNQFSECLTLLSVADTFTVSECTKTINNVLDYFLWLPGEQAMRMMSFMLPILKISAKIRDALIELLRKAMNSSDLKTKRMAVYGFCMILKQLNNSNSQRSQMNVSGMCTQQSISGISLMSQSTLGNRSNPQRHFDMLTLEIIGVLRSCFTQTLDIKITLYENLQRAVELNPKLVPHVLQFIDLHFRSFFNACEDSNANDEGNDAADDPFAQRKFGIKFNKIAKAKDSQEMDIEIYDNLGKLIQFVSNCLVVFENFQSEYSTKEIKRIIHTAMEKTIDKEMEFETPTGNLTALKNELILQQMNFIEGLMSYCFLTSKQTNDNIKNLLPLFKEHESLSEGLKGLSNKKAKKSKTSANNNNNNDTTTGNAMASTSNITINGIPLKKIDSKPENIWDLMLIDRLLRLLHDDIVPFANVQNATPLRSRVSLVRYVLEVAAAKVEKIRLEPAYKQLSHSKRTLKYLTDITKTIYERCIKRLPNLWKNFDLKTASLAAECFRQCLQTANEVYKTKFQTIFVRGFDFHVIDKSKECIAVLHDIIDEFMLEEEQDANAEATAAESLLNDANGRQISSNLFLSLEVLYDNIQFGHRFTVESYSWLLKFCKTYEVQVKELQIVHRLLFKQRQKTHSGAFFQLIPLHLGKIWSNVSDNEVLPTAAEQEEQDPYNTQANLELKSITLFSAESCLYYLYETLRKQIEDVEYFIVKANNLAYKCRIVTEDERDYCLSSLKSMERSICSQLVHISNTLKNLTCVCLPLGTCMDGQMRLLIQHYTCLKNLTKHFIFCSNAGLYVSVQGTKFDLLLKVVGKPLPTNIYALITYIESNILEPRDKNKIKSNPKADKAKVLRETKLIPKAILCIENFNKHVILLAKKTNNRLANFLHFGTVRDFRIKTADLKKAIDRTLTQSSQIDSVESNMEDNDDDDDDVGDDDDDDEASEQQTAQDQQEQEAASNSSRASTPDLEGHDEQNQDAANKVVSNSATTIVDTMSPYNSPSIRPIKRKKTQTQTQTNAAKQPLKENVIKSSKRTAVAAAAEQEDDQPTTSKKAKKDKTAAKQTQNKTNKAGKATAKKSNDLSDNELVITPESEEFLENESSKASCTQLFSNLDKINKKVAKKRTLHNSAQAHDPDVLCAPPPPLEPLAKRRRKVGLAAKGSK